MWQRGAGITFIFVTHDQHEALALSDRIAVFGAGRIEQVGTPSEIYERPATPFVAGSWVHQISSTTTSLLASSVSAAVHDPSGEDPHGRRG